MKLFSKKLVQPHSQYPYVEPGYGKQMSDTVFLIESVQVIIEHAFITKQRSTKNTGIGRIIYMTDVSEYVLPYLVEHLRKKTGVCIRNTYGIGEASVGYSLRQII